MFIWFAFMALKDLVEGTFVRELGGLDFKLVGVI